MCQTIRKPYWGTLILLLAVLIYWPASNAEAQSLASLHYANGNPRQERQSLKQVLTDLENRYHVQFNYVNKTIQDKYVVVELDSSSGQNVDEVIQHVLEPLNLTYEKMGERLFIIFSRQEEGSLQQLPQMPLLRGADQGSASALPHVGGLPGKLSKLEKTISGQVIDAETNEAMPGVNVLAKGTTTGTVTDIDGNYRITVADNVTTLVFSSIGYTSREIEIGGQNIINVNLEPDVQSLSEVVVVGYGTTQKSDLTGALSSVKSEELSAYPAQSVVQALQGRAAGVQVQSVNGEPGASPKIRIRGGTSLNASSDPLYVVDGFVGGAVPPPEDIESIEILKDASATAIYGSRGANGVVLITTKKGKIGAPKIDFNASYSVQEVINRLDLLNGEQFAEYINEVHLDGGGDPNSLPYPNPASYGVGTDWQDQIFRTGGIQNYQLSVSGGSDDVTYYISGNYFGQEGVVINSDYNRYSLTSNLMINPSDELKIGLNLFGRRSGREGIRTQEGSGGTNNAGVISSAFKFAPTQGIYNEDGSFTVNQIGDPHDNPYAVATEQQNEWVNDNVRANVFAEYQILEGLSFRTSFGADIGNERYGAFTPTTLNAGRNVGGSASITSNKITTLLTENYFNYQRELGNHGLNLTAGYSYQSYSREDWMAANRNFVSNSFSYWNLGGGTDFQQASSGLSEWVLASWYGRANYKFLDKYLVTFTGRYDGSSRFGQNNKWAFFPSGAIAWNVTEESFMQNATFLSNLKLRGSYGITGNTEIGTYRSLARFSPIFTVIGGQPVNAVFPTDVSNANLTWESTAQLDIGVDVGILEDRITLAADYYRMVTSDLLFEVPLPEYSGYGTSLQNLGSIENKGFEFSITSRNLSGALSWTTRLNMSFNRNKILSLIDGEDILYSSNPGHILTDQTQILREGEPVGSFYGWIYDGVYQEGDDFLPGTEATPGGVKFRDINGRDESGQLTGVPDGMINNDDRTIIGNPNPAYTFGFNNDFQYKNFDLNVFFLGSIGGDILNYTRFELDWLTGKNNASADALNRWTPTNTNTDVPKASANRAARVSTRWIEDGSFIRLKNIQLGYNLPQSVLGFRQARIYVSAQNILTFTDYKGYDPEVGYQDSNRNLGLDYGSYPNAKSYTFGVNLGF